MEQRVDLNYYYQQLIQDIKSEDDQAALKTSEQILGKDAQDKEVRICQIVALIKLNKLEQALKEITKLGKQQDQNLNYAYVYTLYKLNKLEEALTQIQQIRQQQVDNNMIGYQIIEAQIYNKQNRYEDAVKVYLQILEKDKNNDEYCELTVNMLSASINNISKQPSNKVIILGEEALDRTDLIRELIFNLSLIYININNYDAAEKLLRRFERAVDEEKQDDQDDMNDKIMSQIQRDYITLSLYELQGEELENKIVAYEQYLEENIDQSLKVVIQNNLVLLNSKKQTFGAADNLKRLDEALSSQAKRTFLQELLLNVNKMLLYLIKNKQTEAQKTLGELEKNYSQYIYTIEQFIAGKVYLLYRTRNQKDLDDLFDGILKENHSSIFKLGIILMRAELYRQQQNTKKQLEVLKGIFLLDKNILENELLANYLIAMITKDSSGLQEFKELLINLSNDTQNTVVLNLVGDIFTKEKNYQGASEIYLRSYNSNPNYGTLQKLIYTLVNSDPVKAKELTSKLPVIQIITDQNDLRKLEIDFQNMSKQRAEKEKREQKLEDSSKNIKKKKKKIRYPKGFDPENPGPLPDPERWLPKYQRSKFKKFSKKKLRGPQGMTLGKETTSTFQSGPSTATQDVATLKTSKGKGRRRK